MAHVAHSATDGTEEPASCIEGGVSIDLLTAGADVGTMVTGVSAVTAAYVWTRSQWRTWRQQKLATARRTWRGYIEPTGVNTWYVRLADEQPTKPTNKILVEVVDRDGDPDEMGAQTMRQWIGGDGMLSRSPTPNEMEFLMALRKERGYGKGGLIR